MHEKKQYPNTAKNFSGFSQGVTETSKKRFSNFFILAGIFAVTLATVFLLLSGNGNERSNAADMPVLTGDAALEHLKQDGSADSLQKAFTAARYKIEKVRAGGEEAEADNYENNLRMKFTAGGLELKSTQPKSDWTTKWRLESFGYGENQLAASRGKLLVKNNRVELRREQQNLIEWFVNDPDGVEHGFILTKRPETANADKKMPLRLTMKIEGDLEVQAEEKTDGQNLRLIDRDGRHALNYEKLKVWDAEGKILAARMHTKTAGEVHLEVEDRTATYPLTIDPTFTQEQKLVASDGAAQDFFGESVAISNNTAIIGALGDDVGSNANQGAAYVFVRTGTTWSEQQKLTASDGAAQDFFGNSVAIDGNTVIIGAERADVNSKADQGAAYVFVRTGTTWSEQQKLTASDGAAQDIFGNSVAIDRNTVIVGTSLHDIGSNDSQGAAYVFNRVGTTWSQQQKLTASDGEQGDFFGEDVAVNGTTIVVGASGDDASTTNLAQGSAYVFTRTGATWSQQQKLTASDGALGDYFGFSVAVSGDTAVIGAYTDAIDTKSSQGSAYVFIRTGATWSQQQKLTASDGEQGDRFGTDTAISGDVVIIGAFRDDIDSKADQGSAYTFVRTGTTWAQRQKITTSDGEANGRFGVSVGISSGTAIIGAGGLNSNQGAAYVFKSDTTLSASPSTVVAGGTITVNWTAPANHSTNDRIGLFRVGDPNSAVVDIQNVPAGASGTLTFTAPGTTGQYEFRYLTNGGTSSIAVSNPVTVSATAPTPTPTPNADTIGVFRPTNGITYLRNSNTGGVADVSFIYGVNGDTSIAGDWDNDGKDTLGIYRNGVFYLRNSNTTGPADTVFAFGSPGDQPVAGDWNGDGIDTVGVYRPSTGVFLLRNTNSAGAPDAVFVLGNPNDIAISGDWNGDGVDTTGVFRPSNGLIYLKNTNTSGNADIALVYGNAGDKPIAGDWNGDGIDTIGIYRGGVYYLRNSNTQGVADMVFAFGNPGDEPIAGDWDGLP